MKNLFSLFLLLITIDGSIAFSVVTRANFDGRQLTAKPRRMALTRRYSFFKDIIGEAFGNDRNLSSDKSEGQYDAPGEEFEETSSRNEPLTETQKKWRQSQSGNDVTPELLTGSKWKLDLFLSGVPERDPSNDLYGSKVNISSRDKETGLSLPSTPSTSLTIELLENGVCRSSKSGFTSDEKDGGWKLSDDGKMVRFSLDTLGYTRMVETKGSIQKIYWTKEEEKTLQTTSTYSIPPGFVYGDIEVAAGRQPGTFELGSGGVLRVEKSAGLFGISSKMVSCGKFEAQKDDSD